MKAHQVEAVARDVPALFGPDTVVVPMQKRIPYWYFHRYPGALAGTRVQSVDPSGLIGEHIPCERVIGCVVYPAAELVSPGASKHVEAIASRSASRTERSASVLRALSECFVRGGLQAPVLSDIRGEIWLKLWGNLTFQSHQCAVARDARGHLSISAQPAPSQRR